MHDYSSDGAPWRSPQSRDIAHESRSNQPYTLKRGLAQVMPGLLLVATLIDDPVFGGLIIGAELAFGLQGLLAATGGFVLISTSMAAATAWALAEQPIRLSEKNRQRMQALQARRLGRYLVPHPERPITTAIAAAIFGSVAPILVAGLEGDTSKPIAWRLVLTSGLAYGMVFAAGYGLLGALIGSVT